MGADNHSSSPPRKLHMVAASCNVRIPACVAMWSESEGFWAASERLGEEVLQASRSVGPEHRAGL